MIKLIKWVVLVIFNLLPDSPFQTMIDQLSVDGDILQYLNWFLPLDIVGNMMLAWLDCMLAYILFKIIWMIVKAFLLSKLKLLGSFSSLISGK